MDRNEARIRQLKAQLEGSAQRQMDHLIGASRTALQLCEEPTPIIVCTCHTGICDCEPNKESCGTAPQMSPPKKPRRLTLKYAKIDDEVDSVKRDAEHVRSLRDSMADKAQEKRST